MSQQPPGGYPPPPHDPYAADRALQDWLRARGHELNNTPDLRWYHGWWPFVYMPPLARVGRELRASIGEDRAFLVEGFGNDPIKQATGEDRHLFAFVTSPRLAYRAAVRSKQGAGIVEGIGKGLDALIGGGPQPGSVIGDPTLESRYDVAVPSREEGHAALPMPLRQFLVQTGWRGILELRAGGLACVCYDRRTFDVMALDATLASLAQILAAATQYERPVTSAPPR